MTYWTWPILFLLVAGALGIFWGVTYHTDHEKPYAGQQTREISSLSPKDVAAIEKGQGWGFAKPAELNGYPGPRHVLDLSQKLNLTSPQTDRLQKIFNSMNRQAVDVGAQFLEAERKLTAAFRSKSVDETKLAALVRQSAKLRGELRNVHLDAHLRTAKLLTPDQIAQYVALRGYNGGHGSHAGH